MGRHAEGFMLRDDGKTCRNLDICKSIHHGCEHVCVNVEDSYTCKCYEGFILRGDGKTCRNRDVCKSTNHGCEHICVNTGDSYACKCHEGFALQEDRKTCRSKDPCKYIQHGCEHDCINNNNSYLCKCHEGFILEGNGKTCRIDLVFVIDGSKSLGVNNFEIVKEFVLGILDSLTISPKAARIGLLQYSTQVRTEFTLKQFSTATDMKKAVSQMKYMGKGSMTGLALKQMTERSFTEAEGARHLSAKVPRVCVVFTDGRAQDEVSEWAAKAKQRGITMYAIGIGKAIEEELREIASDPPEKHLFYAEDFSAMGEITEKLQKRMCEEITDVLACPNIAVHHKYLFQEKQMGSTATSGKPKDPCKCENLVTFQNFANAEVQKLTQQYILFYCR
uniref:VWFA domain-containing protein n=1 Tax=Anolis carolinensis TaxID=28377 RepID=A0A803TC11_ANOCA